MIEPKIVMDTEQISKLLELVPHYHACILGPVPFGQSERVLVTLDTIVQPDESAALAAVHERLTEACEHLQQEYDPASWDLVHILPVNCN